MYAQREKTMMSDDLASNIYWTIYAFNTSVCSISHALLAVSKALVDDDIMQRLQEKMKISTTRKNEQCSFQALSSHNLALHPLIHMK